MKNSLGLSGDGDEVDFIEEVEAAFGIKFENKELERCETFGDLYDSLCRHVRPVQRGPFPCLAASAYRRLKKVIATDHPRVKLRPDTPLGDLLRGQDLASWWQRLERESGLRMPGLALSGWCLAVLAVSIAIPVLVAWTTGVSGWMWALLALPVIGVAGPRYWPAQLRFHTLGDLARSTGALNAATLSEPHGDLRVRDVWSSLVLIAREHAANEAVIDRQTYLIG